ncbi:MAG: CRISPR-associated endonuclease Cas1 [Bacteroidota bacterium]
MSLYYQISSQASLLKGFEKVEQSDGSAGFDKTTIESFEADLENQINNLHNELKYFQYKPQPVIFFERIKENNKKRLLSIFSVRDRVVQSSAFIVLNPLFEKEFEKESFGFRKGLSRESAARKIFQFYNKGYKWIVDADIKSYFESVDHKILFEKLNALIKEKEVLDLLRKWVQAEFYLNSKKKKIRHGLLQGSVISPMLANLYLDKFDEALKIKGFKMVRYVDDFIILTKEKPEAEQALNLTKNLLAELKLEINLEKTSITNFESGFKFLGYIFLNSLIIPSSPKDTSKPVFSQPGSFSEETFSKIQSLLKTASIEPGCKIDEEKLKSTELGIAFLEALSSKGLTLDQFLKADETAAELKQAVVPIEAEVEEALLIGDEDSTVAVESNPENYMKHSQLPAASTFQQTLYIQEQGVILKKEGGRFIVFSNDRELLDVPSVKIAHIIIFGNCTVTPAVIQHCLKNEILITLLSSRGKYYGSIETTFNNNTDFERIQLFRSLDEKFTLSLAIEVVKAKIYNSKVVLQRHYKMNKKNEIKSVIENLTRIINKIESAKNVEDVRGYEGVAASGYFSVFGRMLDKSNNFYIERFIRTRRPPLDPVNSLLSFGYTMLASNIYSFSKARRLNPYCGFLHSVRTGHPALVSDLIEEFRFVIDTLVINILNHRILTYKDFYFAKEPGLPCYLTNEARKKFLKQFEIKMHQKIFHPQSSFTVDYRRCLDLQIQQFAQVIRGTKEKYEPFKAAL